MCCADCGGKDWKSHCEWIVCIHGVRLQAMDGWLRSRQPLFPIMRWERERRFRTKGKKKETHEQRSDLSCTRKLNWGSWKIIPMGIKGEVCVIMHWTQSSHHLKPSYCIIACIEMKNPHAKSSIESNSKLEFIQRFCVVRQSGVAFYCGHEQKNQIW